MESGPIHANSSLMRVGINSAGLRLFLIGGLIITVSFVAWQLGYFEAEQRDRIIAANGDVRNSPAAAAIFIGCWILAVILCLPTTVLTIVGGALFGVTRGAVYSWSAAMIGTLVAHALATSLSSRGIQRIFGKHRLLAILQGTDDIWLLIRMRVTPVAPFGVVDYVAGLARVPLRAIMIATAIGIAPGTIAYAFAGSKLRAGMGSTGGSAREAFFIAGAVTLVMLGTTVVPWIVNRVRK